MRLGVAGRTSRAVAALAWAVLASSPAAAASRIQVFSIQDAESAAVADRIAKELKGVKGVSKLEFDTVKAELSVRLEDGVSDATVLQAIARAGLAGVAGAGQGSYLPPAEYPAGADVAHLTHDGSAVGPLEGHRVAGKYTVFDVYADWCAPCRKLDDTLREIAGRRKDVAVRKLDVVDFESALARELGSRFDALPYVVVYTPSGRRIELVGNVEPRKLEKALSAR
jgi:thiol-disulfide isomerase/thioredoxin